MVERNVLDGGRKCDGSVRGRRDIDGHNERTLKGWFKLRCSSIELSRKILPWGISETDLSFNDFIVYFH